IVFAGHRWECPQSDFHYGEPSSFSPTMRSCPSTLFLIRYWGASPSKGRRRTIVYCPFDRWSTPRPGENCTDWPTRNLCSRLRTLRSAIVHLPKNGATLASEGSRVARADCRVPITHNSCQSNPIATDWVHL